MDVTVNDRYTQANRRRKTCVTNTHMAGFHRWQQRKPGMMNHTANEIGFQPSAVHNRQRYGLMINMVNDDDLC